MLKIRCRRCGSESFTASPENIKRCPYCNFDLQTSAPVRRKEERVEIEKDCLILKGALKVNATATDISRKGVGIRVDGSTPLNIDDTIHVIIDDLDIDSAAKVVWVRRAAKDSGTETGIIFNRQ